MVNKFISGAFSYSFGVSLENCFPDSKLLPVHATFKYTQKPAKWSQKIKYSQIAKSLLN